MQNLEAACEEGERAIKKLKLSHPSLPQDYHQNQQKPENDKANRPSETAVEPAPPPFCLFTKLTELYDELMLQNKDNSMGLQSNSMLLDKLVAKERLNTLILNLYPIDKGYSISFPLHSRHPPFNCPSTSSSSSSSFVTIDETTPDTADMVETDAWPYEEGELLEYIANEELPPLLVDIIEQQFNFLYYSGCVIAQVRNHSINGHKIVYKQSTASFTALSNKCDIHHVLLRPTLKSVLADINKLQSSERLNCTPDELEQLESQLLMANQPILCLEPDKSISSRVFEINNNRNMWNTPAHRKKARRSLIISHRKRRLERDLRHTQVIERKLRPIPAPKLDLPPISPPTDGVNISQFFKAHKWPKETMNSQPTLIEDYILETDIPSKEDPSRLRVYHIKLSILQRPSTFEYLGELYLDRDYKPNEENHGVMCRFSLGTMLNANRYVHQFMEIFTESGRKAVRILYNPEYKERMSHVQVQAQAQLQEHNNSQNVNLAQQHLNQLTQASATPSTSSSTHPMQPNQSSVPLVNGVIGLVHPNQTQNTSSVPILQSHLQGTTQLKTVQQQASTLEMKLTPEMKISAIEAALIKSSQQLEAAAAAKQQQQQQKLLAGSASNNNPEIRNLLNSSLASTVNSEASAALVNAITNSALGTTNTKHQLSVNPKILARKFTGNLVNARVLNHAGGSLILNNNRIEAAATPSQQQQQPQTITLSTSGSYSYAPLNKQLNQWIITNNPNAEAIGGSGGVGGGENKSLQALLVNTAASNRPEIVASNSSPLVREKLETANGPTHFIQNIQGGSLLNTQSPKSCVISPMSSPPPPSPTASVTTNLVQNNNILNSLNNLSAKGGSTATAINVQGLNFAQLQGVHRLQNVQVQLPSFAIPISLGTAADNASSGTTSLIVSLPVTSPPANSNIITQAPSSAGNAQVSPPTAMVLNAGATNLAQLVASGVKQPTGATIRQQPTQQFQVITPLQRTTTHARLQPTPAGNNQTTTRQLPRATPITIKSANASSQSAVAGATAPSTLTHQFQKAHLQQYQQQLCLNKIRRRSNASADQQ